MLHALDGAGTRSNKSPAERSRHPLTKSYKRFSVVNAAVTPFSQIQETYPELVTEIDPTDFTRLRYAVTVQNAEGELRRVRLLQWNDRSLALWNELPKGSAELAKGVVQVLMYSVEHMAPDVVESKLRPA